ncbi:glycosyl hydrolase catalytic core-domain-containing protein [Crepidotus variabilis]|uniref:Glycosyl hydrolase catalytic core-domain-containing protein n=1 Tax=Crepidotus variabilis TaxID=179855 RepID=A0A9P6JQT9_9AGAR|nr:glycosyl hydrolase catalytic core-domain-containing protein [Crepidotus variabilis]
MDFIRFVFVSIMITILSVESGAIPASSMNKRAVTNSSKAGLGWPNADSVDIKQYQNLGKISWYYTWSVWPIQQKTNFEFVPMLWGPKTVKEFQEKINTTLQNATPNITAVLGMNEPEQPGQSNMTVTEAVDMWKANMEPLRPQYNVRLGSPVVSSGPAGKIWIGDFLKACNTSCSVDFIALHWYGTDANAFIAYLWDFYYAFNKTIWVTEWACHDFVNLKNQCSETQVIDFLNKTQSFMDNSTFVERYAWYGAMEDTTDVNGYNAIMDKKGKINSLGLQYGGDATSIKNGTSVSLSSGLTIGDVSPLTVMLFTGFISLSLVFL